MSHCAIVGRVATGKTSLANDLAELFIEQTKIPVIYAVYQGRKQDYPFAEYFLQNTKEITTLLAKTTALVLLIAEIYTCDSDLFKIKYSHLHVIYIAHSIHEIPRNLRDNILFTCYGSLMQACNVEKAIREEVLYHQEKTNLTRGKQYLRIYWEAPELYFDVPM